MTDTPETTEPAALLPFGRPMTANQQQMFNQALEAQSRGEAYDHAAAERERIAAIMAMHQPGGFGANLVLQLALMPTLSPETAAGILAAVKQDVENKKAEARVTAAPSADSFLASKTKAGALGTAPNPKAEG